MRVPQHWPEQAAQADTAEELERKAVLPGLFVELQEGAGPRGASGIDQDVAAAMPFGDLVEHLFAAFGRAQVGGAHIRPQSGNARNRLGRRVEFLL